MELSKILQEAIDNNVLVYDADAEVGQFTARLFVLLNEVGFNMKHGRIAKAYILPSLEDEWIYKEVEEWNFCGVPYKIIPEDSIKEYKDMNATLASGDIKLMLVQYDDGTHMIGSY